MDFVALHTGYEEAADADLAGCDSSWVGRARLIRRIFSVPLFLNLSPKLFLTKLKSERNMPGAWIR
jgi:hypothetical protein